MPELPEVEIIKRGLEQRVIGKKIVDIEVRLDKMFQGKKEDIIGAKVEKIRRWAKMLEIGLSGGKSILIHLKMTGQLVYREKAEGVEEGKLEFRGGHPEKNYLGKLPNRFTHLIFHFTNGGALYFNDLRRFGWAKIYETDEISRVKAIRELGPEPFDAKFTSSYLLKAAARRPRSKIKQVLMDQTIAAGVGNIYADEALFCTGVSPLRLSGTVKLSEFEKIVKCLKRSLKRGLEFGGSSENTFVNVEGARGKMQDHLLVYRRAGQKCFSCTGGIKRVKIAGRGAHFCPNCQK